MARWKGTKETASPPVHGGKNQVVRDAKKVAPNMVLAAIYRVSRDGIPQKAEEVAGPLTQVETSLCL